MKNRRLWVWSRETAGRRNRLCLVVMLMVLALVTACGATDTPQAGMANPAAVHCEEQGYVYEIRTAADGSQSGVCKFPDGSECDAWDYFRGECQPGPEADSTPTATASP